MAKAYAQLKYENAVGFEGTSDTFGTKTVYPPFIDITFDEGAQHMNRDDEARGTDEPVPLITELFNPKFSGTMRMYPDLVGFVLKWMFGAPVSTAGNGALTDPDTVIFPVGTTKHIWTAPFGPAGVSPQTVQAVLAYFEESVFYRVKGMALDTFEITTPDQGGAMIKFSGQATYAARISDPSLTPVPESIAVRPFTKSGLALPTWLAGSGVHEDYSTSVASPIDVDHTIGSASMYPDTVEKGNGVTTVSGSIDQRHIDPDDRDALIAATSFATKAKWLNGSIAAGSYKHTLWQELSAAQYDTGNPDPLTNSRRHGASFSFRAANNGAASSTWTLVNATAAYT